MSCDEIRDRLENLWEGGDTAEAELHLKECAPCAQYSRELDLLRSGFHLLKEEEVPSPSVGFAERVVRRLAETTRSSSLADFFELVGRRFVYATLVLTFLTLLALALPSTGPVRGLTVTDIQTTVQESSLAYTDPMGDPAAQEAPDYAVSENPAHAGAGEVK
jgi:hypothetical protein